MRRKEKQITEFDQIETVIQKAMVCRLGLVDEPAPYIVPMSFGYQDHTLYFHSAVKGKKIQLLENNPNVCFEIDAINKPVKADRACDWGMSFQSIIGTGTAVFITEMEEKKKALTIIMAQYADDRFDFPDKKVMATAVFKVKIHSMTGKQSGCFNP